MCCLMGSDAVSGCWPKIVKMRKESDRRGNKGRTNASRICLPTVWLMAEMSMIGRSMLLLLVGWG